MRAAHARFRGVICNSCGKPIKLSASFIEGQISQISITEETTLEDLGAKVFPVRCEACHGEGIYSLRQIDEFLGG